MGQIDLGRVQGHSIAKINRVSSSGNIDTYEVKLDDNTSAGQFTVTNGIDGTNGLNGKDGKDGAPGKDGTLISVNGQLVDTFNADNKSDLPIDSLSSSETKKPLSANMGRQLDLTKAPTSHASADTAYGIGSATNYGHVKASSTTPLMNGTANLGTDNGCYAREGHVHPTDTSRAAKEHTHKVSDLTEGTLPVVNGGTGRTNFPDGEILIGNGSNELTTIRQSNLSVGYAVSAGSSENATKADKADHAESADRAQNAENANTSVLSSMISTNLGDTKFRVYDEIWAPGKDDSRWPSNDSMFDTGIVVAGAVVTAKSKSYYGAGPVLAVEKSGNKVAVVVDNDAGDLAGFCLIVWGR